MTQLDSLHVVDPSIRAELEMVGGAELPARLVEMYVDDANSLIQRIDTALQTKDGADAAKAAHRLKGGAAAVGAQRVAAVAKDMEESAKSGDFATLANRRSQFTHELHALQRIMGI